MGQGASRAADDEFFEGGVRVTQGLLEQLEGKPRGSGRAPQQATSLALGPGADVSRALAAQAAAQDRTLGRALERSRRVGGLLLKAEGEELRRIDELAAELAASEYAAPSRPRPCRQQADECVRCYAEHEGDTLVCSAAVEAYSACAKAAWQQALQRAV